ncbi:tetratricopeptide repeat protein [Flagellimonas sp. 389]|uniref:tetratricopeptide repeat protein n=1 Tax=Flagellimonas sp. 389 TaxID=2835862 RepID=UPI001BD5D576|nr:tetratricopeptide repeat protein [Flagellimonas sp. 389]MBS9463028.1 tetratricopeptide repeat protein [Flagellimonas sp. 389]
MKYQSSVSLLLFLLFSSINAQNQKIVDSLKNELKNEQLNDSIRTVILTMLHERLMFSNPEEARGYALKELEIYENTGLEMAYGLGNLHLGDYYFNKSMNDSSLYFYKIAKSNFTKNNKTRGLIFVNYTIAEIYKSSGNYKQALELFEGSIAEIEKNITDEPYKSQFLASSYLAIGSCYLEKGDLNLALRESLKALKLYEKIDDDVRRADALKQVGDIESMLKHLGSALTYYKEAQKIYKEYNDNIYEVRAINSIGEIYTKLDDLTNAESKQKEAIELSRKYNVKEVLAKALHDLGLIRIQVGEFLEARDLLIESKLISEQETLELRTIYANQALSMLDFKEKKYSSALNKVDLAIDVSQSNGTIITLKDLYELRSNILEKLNNNEEALTFYKKAQKINDSITSIEKVRQIEELKTIYETEKKEVALALQEEEIKTLNEKSRADSLQKGLYASGMASALALFGLSVFGYRQRIKKNRIAREKQEEIYKQEIAHKQKELASQTLHLVQKNTFIQELKENLQNLKNSPEKFKAEFRRIVMLLKKENASDKDWEIFKTYFADVHNDFDQKLKTLYSDISEKEIRLAAFLRMNLTTKEIAATLNVLPDSILKSKYRLKKKLGLDKETDLTSFLSQL